VLKLKRLNWKVSIALIIVFVVGALADRSFFYIIQQNQSVSDTKQQPSDESIEVSSDKAVARYTEVLAWFTAVLAGVGMFQGYLAARQIKLSRDQFELSIKRPWVFVSGAYELKFIPAKGQAEREPLTTPAGEMYIEYVVANHGEAPAIIEGVICDLIIAEMPFKPQVVDREHPLMISPILGPGERIADITATLPQRMIKKTGGLLVNLVTGMTIPEPDIPDGKELFFWIIIQYRGISSVGHETSAVWRYEKNGSLAFMHTGGKERNYAK
jgi:hypothetical protein